MLGAGVLALSRWPVQTMVSTLRQASRPPLAATFLATISGAVSAVAGFLAPLVASAVTAAVHAGVKQMSTSAAPAAQTRPDPRARAASRADTDYTPPGLVKRVAATVGFTAAFSMSILCVSWEPSTAVSSTKGSISPCTGRKSR